MRILCITKPNKIMKNLLIAALIVSAFACTKKEAEVKVDPNTPGKFEYTYTARPESQDRTVTISFNFYSIQGGKNVNTSKTFTLTQSNNVVKWDTTLSANKVTANIVTSRMYLSAFFDARFKGVTVYSEEVSGSASGRGLLTKDL